MRGKGVSEFLPFFVGGKYFEEPLRMLNAQKCLPGSDGQADSGLNLDLTEP